MLRVWVYAVQPRIGGTGQNTIFSFGVCHGTLLDYLDERVFAAGRCCWRCEQDPYRPYFATPPWTFIVIVAGELAVLQQVFICSWKTGLDLESVDDEPCQMV